MTAVLFSFALVVVVVTLLVLTAVGRVADYSNQLDDARSQETTSGALKTFRSQLVATLNDYAAWDDAAKNVYAADGMDWVVGNYGEMSVNSSLFNVVAVVDDSDTAILAYRDGKPMAETVDSFFGPALRILMKKVRSVAPDKPPEVSGFMRTEQGIAVVGVALIRQKSGAVTVAKGQYRYLIFARHLDEERVKQLADTYVISGLHLVPPEVEAAYSVTICDPERTPIARLVWSSRAPGDASFAQARPLVIEALGLVGFFFVVLLIIGLVTGRRLRAEEVLAREAALRDRLSGLLNREGMQLGASQLVENAANDGSDVLLLYLDLDGFKEVNDSYGHGAGDQLIRAVAAGLEVLLPSGAILARLGGDEFAIILATTDGDDAAAMRLGDCILDFLAEPLQIGSRAVVIGASIGLAASPAGTIGAEELLRRADLAMYKAKESGRGRVARYEDAMDVDRDARASLELDLANAIEDEALTLVYQPMVEARSHRLTAVEALVRWDRQGFGPVPPDVFVPAAESGGMIEALGLFVLRAACQAACRWPDLRIAVNIAPGQFRNPAFAAQVREILQETGVMPGRVMLEVTESLIVQNPKRMRQSMERLQLLGVRIALDDFGSGFSSIGHLRQFPFDRIKIDRSLISDALENGSARDMLEATVALTRSLHIPVTAEGIETAAQAASLRAFGCDELQGYFFGRPMSEAEISARLEQETRRDPKKGDTVAA